MKPTSPPPPGPLAEAYRAYGKQIYRRCRRILRDADEARDVTQEVFIRGLAREEELRTGPELLGWLYVVAQRLCLNRIRDKTVRERTPPAPPTRAPEATLADRDLARRALDGVGESTQLIALNVLVDGMTHEEAAKAAKVSERTVRNKLSRFMSEVRRRADKEEAREVVDAGKPPKKP